MNTKDLSGIAIVIRMKLLNTAGRQILTLTGTRRKLLIGKVVILWRSAKRAMGSSFRRAPCNKPYTSKKIARNTMFK